MPACRSDVARALSFGRLGTPGEALSEPFRHGVARTRTIFAHRMASAASAASKGASHTAAARKTSALAQRIAALCQEFKATDITILSLKGVSDMTDYFVIASGTSDAHVRGLADGVLDAMQDAGLDTHHVEGLTHGRWVLLDFVDVVVHLFHPETRAFYQLERLWQDAPVLLADP